MGNIIVEINEDGVRELMQSAEMMEVCRTYAERALGALGDGYEMSTYTGKTRVNAEVAAASFKARRANLKNNTILKAIGSVGE